MSAVYHDAYHDERLETRPYAVLVGLYLLIGLQSSIFGISRATGWEYAYFWPVLLGCLPVLLITGLVAFFADEPVVSTLAYLFFMATLGVWLAYIGNPPSLIWIFSTASSVALGLALIGLLTPFLVKKGWTVFLLSALLAILVANCPGLMPIFGLPMVKLSIWTVIGSLLLSGLIAFEMQRAMSMEKYTMDEVVGAGLGLFADPLQLPGDILEWLEERRLVSHTSH